MGGAFCSILFEARSHYVTQAGQEFTMEGHVVTQLLS